jgi:PadR family transcriptional regulator PadR
MPKHLAGLEELILLAVASLGDAAYGVTVQETLAAQTRASISLGAVYLGLERLEHRGFVRSWLGEATAARGGRRKRMFRATPQGLAALREMERIRANLFTLSPKHA